ncbi:hypothetical protein ACRZER_003319 [Raoultella ornithinolytica]|uniref:hypothetical protein n=1 Tax=Raoultella TaxID=160674 RepID=UPI0007EA8E29|nr:MULTISPECIES: hypothetical protein [Raoultella]ELS5404112.1 hypothetical protein [Raoultella ornithinolytica]ELS5456062.1 hypothetical protein [Raoultella ornithinolytica]ELS5480380.1 hypothetical protein [Raoultella ornithinolytica]MDV1388442.1 hypothetical protein [Raoultella ornithinolytica]OAZ77838.1 hypothetical protein AYO04_07700 [Raoultella planticola]
MAKKPFSFAHLIGFGASAAEEEDDKKSKKAKARRAEEDERDDAEDDERDDDAEEDERDDDAEDDDDDPDASEEGDSDDDDDRKEGKTAKSARIAERKRCARIFGSKHAAANPSLAASLAFNTGMSAAAAIDVLASTAPVSQPQAHRKRSLDQRMQESENVRLGQDGEKPSGGKATLVNKMTSLYNSTKGEK